MRHFLKNSGPWLGIFLLAAGLALVPFVASMSGCASGTKIPPIAAQIAVQYATMKVVERNPDYAPRIVEIARNVRASASGDTSATVLAIDTLIRAQIRWEKLAPSDRLVVELLLTAIRDELAARIGGGVLDPAKLLIVSQVAGWIETAAQAAGGPTLELELPLSR